MGFGEVLWVRRSGSPLALLHLLNEMAPTGLRLTHPETGGIRHLTDDSPVETTFDAFGLR